MGCTASFEVPKLYIVDTKWILFVAEEEDGTSRSLMLDGVDGGPRQLHCFVVLDTQSSVGAVVPVRTAVRPVTAAGRQSIWTASVSAFDVDTTRVTIWTAAAVRARDAAGRRLVVSTRLGRVAFRFEVETDRLAATHQHNQRETHNCELHSPKCTGKLTAV